MQFEFWTVFFVWYSFTRCCAYHHEKNAMKETKATNMLDHRVYAAFPRRGESRYVTEL